MKYNIINAHILFKQKGTASSIDTTGTKPHLQNVSMSDPKVPFAKQYARSNKVSTKVKGLFSSITELIACKMQQIFLLATSGIILSISGIIYYYYRVQSYLTVKPHN